MGCIYTGVSPVSRGNKEEDEALYRDGGFSAWVNAGVTSSLPLMEGFHNSL